MSSRRRRPVLRAALSLALGGLAGCASAPDADVPDDSAPTRTTTSTEMPRPRPTGAATTRD